MATNTAATQLFRYFGLSGTPSVRTSQLVPRADTPDAAQRLFQDFSDAGQIANADIWTRFNSVLKRPTTFDSMLQLWDEMAQWDLVAAALVEIVDESTQTDANSPGTLWFQCNDEKLEQDLNDMVQNLDVEAVLPSQFWHLAALGNSFEKLEYLPGEGVLGMTFIHPMDIRRYWLERNRKCVGFRWNGHKPNKEDIFVRPDNKTPVERVAIGTGQSTEDLWYPWDIMHMRRMFRMRTSEHGEPVFAEADGIYKKLRLAVDQMVVHRAQIQPDRYHISIDTQEQPPIEQMKTVQRWRQALRSKLAFGQGATANDLSGASDFQSFYNAWALDTVIYLAQPKGFQNTIGKLPGTTQVPDVYDIELLTDLFYCIIGMPRSWFGGQGRESGGSQAPSGRALLAQDIRFLRKVKSLRRPVIDAYTWLGYFHAILKGIDVQDKEIKVLMPPIGGLEEQMKMELLEKQASLLGILADVMQAYNLPKEAWIEVIFKRYMHLPDDVVHVFMTALPAQIDTTAESRKDAPRTSRLVREVAGVVDGRPETKNLVSEIQRLATGLDAVQTVRKTRRFARPSEAYELPSMKANDVIISSFGLHPFEINKSGQPSTHAVHPGSAPITEAVQSGNWEPYRKWIQPRG